MDSTLHAIVSTRYVRVGEYEIGRQSKRDGDRNRRAETDERCDRGTTVLSYERDKARVEVDFHPLRPKRLDIQLARHNANRMRSR